MLYIISSDECLSNFKPETFPMRQLLDALLSSFQRQQNWVWLDLRLVYSSVIKDVGISEWNFINGISEKPQWNFTKFQ